MMLLWLIIFVLQPNCTCTLARNNIIIMGGALCSDLMIQTEKSVDGKINLITFLHYYTLCKGIIYNTTMQCVIIILIAGDTCLLGENRAVPGDDGGIMETVQLQCTVNIEVPRPVPLPSLTWFRNGLEVARFAFGDFKFDITNFQMQFPILTPGVFSSSSGIFLPFQIFSSGEVVFTTEFFNNITMPMLGNLAPDTTLRQARAILFDILLANWTCVAYSSLGTAAVEYLIGVCGKLEELLQFDIMT